MITKLYTNLKSPLGKIILVGTHSSIEKVVFGKIDTTHYNEAKEESEVFKGKKQLIEYFEGQRLSFDLSLSLIGTDFQKKTWSALKEIPFGKIVTYGDIAKKLGKPKASRAIGGANNRNPLPLFIPCHRVLGASGELVGFAPGLQLKRILLELEGHKIRKNRVIPAV